MKYLRTGADDAFETRRSWEVRVGGKARAEPLCSTFFRTRRRKSKCVAVCESNVDR